MVATGDADGGGGAGESRNGDKHVDVCVSVGGDDATVADE